MKIAHIAAALLLVPALVSGQTTISTPASGITVGPFGRPDTQTYGQTFRTPATDTKLDNFSFWISSSTAFEMKAYVFAWDGRKASGSALFESGLLFTSVGDFVKTTVQIGGLNLVAGDAYVFFLSTTGLQGNSTALMEINTRDGDTDTDRRYVFQNNGDDASLWTGSAWNSFPFGNDLRHEANFDQSVVPEPSTYALMATGLLGLGAVARRRRTS